MNNINELASIVALEELKNHLVSYVNASSEYDEWVIEIYDTIKHDLETFKLLQQENQMLKEARDFARNKNNYTLYKTSEKIREQLLAEVDRLNEEVEEEMHNYQDMGRLYHKTATRCDKLEKVIAFLKDTFEITLDSKLRISDGIDCVQAFPLNLSTHEIVYDDVKEVLIDGK